MKTIAKLSVLFCFGAIFWVTFSSAESEHIVPYPEGYRHWVHIKSAVIGPDNPIYARYGGLHHIYANTKAMEGFRTGKFPDGAIIVFDLLEVRTKDGVIEQDKRRFIDVMHKDSSRFAKTGGWGFEEFRGDSHTERVLSEQAKTGCFNCHSRQKDFDFVFSSFRE